MHRTLIAAGAIWTTSSISTAEILTQDTGIAIGLVVAGVSATCILTWKARGDRDRVQREIDELRCKSDAIQAILDKMSSNN